MRHVLNTGRHRIRKSKWLLAIPAGLAALFLAFNALPASAHDPVGTENDPMLVKFTKGVAEVQYNKLRNAPGSPQPNALRMETTGAGTRAGVNVDNVGILGRALGEVESIRIKARSTNPQVSIQLGNNHWLSLRGGNCTAGTGAVDFGSGWTQYRFLSDGCSIAATTGVPDDPATTDVNESMQTYASWSATVSGEGAGSTIKRVRVVARDADATSWVDDIRLDNVLFAGPNITRHNH